MSIPAFLESSLFLSSRNVNRFVKIIGNPITIVYAGNLLFGREQMMVEFAKALESVNTKGLSHQFLLKVFSNTNPFPESLGVLDDKKNSLFMGCKPYSEVCEEMDKSELVLFIESFDKKNIQMTRLSFSTKIIDCMDSGCAVMAIYGRYSGYWS